MTDEKSTPQGPVDPHGSGGIDAPAPPGGAAPAVHHDARDVPDDPERAGQLENAGTSMDEPSDGSGGE